MSTEIMDKPKTQMTAPTINYMSLIEKAVESDLGLEKLEKLFELQNKWEAKQARSSYADAMSKFQAECPDIIKKKQGHNCKYAPLEDIVSQTKSLMRDCGFSYRFEQQQTSDGNIIISCINTHIDGHSEAATMSSGADTSGNKNSIQSIASTVTYLRRYTFTGVFGIVTADEDIDGRLPEKPIDREKLQKIIVDAIGSDEAYMWKWLSDGCQKEIASFDDMTDRQLKEAAEVVQNAQ